MTNNQKNKLADYLIREIEKIPKLEIKDIVPLPSHKDIYESTLVIVKDKTIFGQSGVGKIKQQITLPENIGELYLEKPGILAYRKKLGEMTITHHHTKETETLNEYNQVIIRNKFVEPQYHFFALKQPIKESCLEQITMKHEK